jgi:two-component system NtrC family sensor kinase
MKIPTKTQLALIFFSLACLIGVVTSLIVNSLISSQIIFEAQERVKENLNTARWVYTSKIRDIDRTIRWISIRHVLKDAIKKKDVSAIRDEFLGVMAEEGLDFLTVVDRKGTVISRFHNPRVSGDSLVQDPFIRKAIENKGISGTQVLPREELLKDGEALANKAAFRLIPTPKEKLTEKAEETSGMVLKSAYPVLDFNGELLGVITGGVLLNRNYELVDRIKNIVFKDAKYEGKEIGTATIFMGDLRVSTNVLDKEGNRAIGTRVMKEVYGQVFEKGIPWIHRAFVVDDWYITAYEPIRDVQDNIAGMLYVGMLESKYALMKERLILLFFLFSMVGMLLALLVSFFLSWKILKKSS